jgi:hypothetical protein
MSVRVARNADATRTQSTNRLSEVLAVGLKVAPGPATNMAKRRREPPTVLNKEYWYLYLKHEILEKLNDFETDRDVDDERVDYDYVSSKWEEVNKKLEAKREEWEKLKIGDKNYITLVASESAGELKERIEKAFVNQFYGQDDDYDTDEVINTLIENIIKDTEGQD